MDCILPFCVPPYGLSNTKDLAHYNVVLLFNFKSHHVMPMQEVKRTITEGVCGPQVHTDILSSFLPNVIAPKSTLLFSSLLMDKEWQRKENMTENGAWLRRGGKHKTFLWRRGTSPVSGGEVGWTGGTALPPTLVALWRQLYNYMY